MKRFGIKLPDDSPDAVYFRVKEIARRTRLHMRQVMDQALDEWTRVKLAELNRGKSVRTISFLREVEDDDDA